MITHKLLAPFFFLITAIAVIPIYTFDEMRRAPSHGSYMVDNTFHETWQTRGSVNSDAFSDVAPSLGNRLLDGRIANYEFVDSSAVPFPAAAPAPSSTPCSGSAAAPIPISDSIPTTTTIETVSSIQSSAHFQAAVPTSTPIPAQHAFENYVEVFSPVAGEEYIIVIDEMAVGNSIHVNNHYLTAHSVSINSGTLSVPDYLNSASIRWLVGGSTAFGWTFRNVENGKYIGRDSSEYLYPSSTAVAWCWQNGDLINLIDSYGYYYLSLSATKTYFNTATTANGNIRLFKSSHECEAVPTEVCTSMPCPITTPNASDEPIPTDVFTATPSPIATPDVTMEPSPTEDSSAIPSPSATPCVTSDPIPSATPGSGRYIEVSVPAAGDQIVIVIDGMAVGNSAHYNEHYLKAMPVNVNAYGRLKLPSGVDASSLLWIVDGSESLGFTFYNAFSNMFIGFDPNGYICPSDTAVAWKWQNGVLKNQIDSAGYYYLTLNDTKTFFTTGQNPNTGIRLYKYTYDRSLCSSPDPEDDGYVTA